MRICLKRSRFYSSFAALNEHHAPNGGFRNPPSWNSHVNHTSLSFFTEALPEWDRTTQFPRVSPLLIPWSLVRNPESALQALFVGHATFLLQSRGINMLTDPFFSNRASLLQSIGPERYSPPACSINELPPLDLVLLSHNHYDHLDSSSVTQLLEKAESDAKSLTFCIPLGMTDTLKQMGVPGSNIRTLDWWESTTLTVSNKTVQVTAVPAQHNSARYPWDRNASLWSYHTEYF